MSHILIYGAGAVGSFVGGLMADGGQEVTLVTRSGAERISNNGLTILRANHSRVHVKPNAVPTLRQAIEHASRINRPYDFVFMGMKTYDLPDAINEMIAYRFDPARIVTLQNGIDAEKALVAQFGAERITAGSLTVPVKFDHDLAVVEERKGRGIAFAPMVAGDKTVAQVASMTKKGGITTKLIRNVDSMKWSKALVNIIGNATSAIINRPPGKLYQYRPIFNLEQRMLKETLAVMKARKIPIVELPGTSAKQLLRGMRWLPKRWLHEVMKRQVASGRGNKMPSFQIDLAAGKQKNEVQFHNGAIAEYGRELGVPVGINAALNDILMGIALGHLEWDRFNGKPKAFMSAVSSYLKQERQRA